MTEEKFEAAVAFVLKMQVSIIRAEEQGFKAHAERDSKALHTAMKALRTVLDVDMVDKIKKEANDRLKNMSDKEILDGQMRLF